jgi:outer membrane protein assembly factor BamB
MPALAADDDWPTWRHDNQRSAASEQPLPANPTLLWKRRLPVPLPLWRRPMDNTVFTYEPVSAGGLVLVPSMITGSVSAYDLQTGEERWRFYADGAVWLAPCVDGQNVYFGSDDGHLYCLKLETGTLVWKRDLAPPAHRVWFNGQITAPMPVHVAPLVEGASVYCISVGFQGQGRISYVLDAKTGEVTKRVDGMNKHVGGYGAIQGNQYRLGYDANIPLMQQYSLYKNRAFGSSLLSGAGNLWVVYPRGFISPIVDGDRLIYSRNLRERGKAKQAPPEPWRFDVVSMPFDALPAQPAEDSVQQPQQKEEALAKAAWSLEGRYMLHARAGRQIVAGTWGDESPQVVLIDIPSAPGAAATVPWKAPVDTPAQKLTMMQHTGFYQAGTRPYLVPAQRGLVARGKIVLTTAQGTIYCFGDGKGPAKDWTSASKPVPAGQANPQIAQALKSLPDRAGHALIVGGDAATALPQIIAGSDLEVLVVESDPAKADALRRSLDDQGLLGMRRRAQVIGGGPESLAILPIKSFNLIVAPSALLNGDGSLAQICELLRPGGQCCVPGGSASADRLRQLAGKAGLPLAVSSEGPSLMLRRTDVSGPGILCWPGLDVTNSNSTRSKFRLPVRVQWLESDELLYERPARLCDQGRLMLAYTDAYPDRSRLAVGEDHPTTVPSWSNDGTDYTAGSFDVYTGKRLWSNEQFMPVAKGGRVQLMGEVILSIGKGSVSAISAVDGKPLKHAICDRFTDVRDIKVDQGVAVVHHGDALDALDVKQMTSLWTAKLPANGALVLGGGRVFAAGGGSVVACDLRSGAVAWELPYKEERPSLTYSPVGDLVRVASWKWLRGKDGTQPWTTTSKGGYAPLVFTAAIQDGDDILNPLTGEKIQAINYGGMGYCGLNFRTGFGDYTFDRGPGWFADTMQGVTYNPGVGLKAGCHFPFATAEDVLIFVDALNPSCRCGTLQGVSVGFVHDPTGEMWANLYSGPKGDGALPTPEKPVKHLGVNCGAFGDRREGDCDWYNYWNTPGRWIPDKNTGLIAPDRFFQHSSWVTGPMSWVGASGVLKAGKIQIPLGAGPERGYTVKLYFCEPADVIKPGWPKPGERVFSVQMQGKEVIKDLDIIAETQQPNRVLVKEIKGVRVTDALALELIPGKGDTLLCGVECVQE